MTMYYLERKGCKYVAYHWEGEDYAIVLTTEGEDVEILTTPWGWEPEVAFPCAGYWIIWCLTL